MLRRFLSSRIVLAVVSLVVMGTFVSSTTIGYATVDSLRTKSTVKDTARSEGLAEKMFGYGFLGERGIALAHEKIFKVKAAAAFNEGRAIQIFGHNAKEDLDGLAAEFVRKSGEVGISETKVETQLLIAQSFLRDAVFSRAFIERVITEIAKIDENKVQKDIEKKLAKKSALAFLKKIKEIAAIQDVAEFNKQARKAVVEDTRFITFLFGSKGMEPSLLSVGNILSKEHRELVAHIGTYAYEGSQNIEGGPRTIYTTLARINAFQEYGKEGVELFQEMMLHEFMDMAQGKHVDSSPEIKSKLITINAEIDKKYRDVVMEVVTEVTEEGPVVVSNDKVRIEKYRIANDLGKKDTFAIKGSSKVHPGVPKGKELTITIAKADVGSIGGHGTAPGQMLEAVAEQWMQAAERGEIVDFFITRVGDDISVIVTHDRKKDDRKIHEYIWNGFVRGAIIAKDLGYYAAGQDLLADAFSGNVKGAGPSVAEMVIKEQASEVVIFAQADKTAPGAFNRGLWNILFGPDTTWRPLGPGEAENIKVGMLDFDYNNYAGRHIWFTKKDYDDAYWYGGYPDRYTYDLVQTGNGEDMAAVTAQRLGIIMGQLKGEVEYVGKDDPMFMIRSQKRFPAVGEITSAFLKGEYIVPGWMRGSNKGPFFPVALPDAKIGIYDGPPLLSMWSFNLNDGRLEGFYDLMAANPAIRYIQDRRAAAAVRQLEEGFHEMGLRLGPEEIEYQKGPTLIEGRLKDRWEAFEAKKDSIEAVKEQKETDVIHEKIAKEVAGKKTVELLTSGLELAWGKKLAPIAAAFPDINRDLSNQLMELHNKKQGQVYAVLMNDETLLKQGPDGIMTFANYVEQLGVGNIKPVFHINRDDVKPEEAEAILDKDFAKINEINEGHATLSQDMFAAVVVGTNPKDIARQVKEKLGADIYQVFGLETYVKQFSSIAKIKVILDPATPGKFTSMAKALKLIELIPEEGKVSSPERLQAFDELFSQDKEGNFHVKAVEVGKEVLEQVEEYKAEIAAAIAI